MKKQQPQPPVQENFFNLYAFMYLRNCVVCVCVFTYSYVYVCVYVCAHVSICVYVYVHVYVCLYICVCLYVHMCVLYKNPPVT